MTTRTNTKQAQLATTLTELAQRLDAFDAEFYGTRPRTTRIAKVGALAARGATQGERDAAFARLRETIAGRR